MRALKPSTLVPLVTVATFALVSCGDPVQPTTQASSAARPPEATAATPAVDQGDAGSPTLAASGGHQLGEPLDHPERYYGLYANPDTPDRQWFVAAAKRPKYAEQAPEVPPGYLAIGAMFGDVAPWHMKTLSATSFEQGWVPDYQPEPARVEFELGDDGRAVAMTFTDAQYASQGRLVRQGDLPEGWE